MGSMALLQSIPITRAYKADDRPRQFRPINHHCTAQDEAKTVERLINQNTIYR